MNNINNINKESIKYFIYIISLNKELPYIPREIREIIWKKYFTEPYISCIICNQVILNFNINILESINTETTYMSNGAITCWPCRYAEDIMF